MANGKQGCCICWGIIALILYIALISASFRTLSPLEAGIKINTITQAISTRQAYTAGRYHLGPQYNFIRYPINLQTIEFSSNKGADSPLLRASTMGGQTVQLEISFQFRLMVDKLVPLYQKYEMSYKNQYVTIASDTLKNLVSMRYALNDYYQMREGIGLVMHAALNQRFQQDFAVVEHFQLRRVMVPAAVDANIIATFVQQQNVQKVSVVQQSTLVRASTSVISSQATQSAVVANAEAAKQATIIVESANAQASILRLNATATAYDHIKQSLQYTNAQLLQHLFLETIRTLGPNNKLLLGVPEVLAKN